MPPRSRAWRGRAGGARGTAGVECFLSDGEGFPTRVAGPVWSDENGWGVMQYWSTMRLADVDGDGRDDLCIRTSTDLRCVLSTGDGFGEDLRRLRKRERRALDLEDPYR